MAACKSKPSLTAHQLRSRCDMICISTCQTDVDDVDSFYMTKHSCYKYLCSQILESSDITGILDSYNAKDLGIKRCYFIVFTRVLTSFKMVEILPNSDVFRCSVNFEKC